MSADRRPCIFAIWESGTLPGKPVEHKLKRCPPRTTPTLFPTYFPGPRPTYHRLGTIAFPRLHRITTQATTNMDTPSLASLTITESVVHESTTATPTPTESPSGTQQSSNYSNPYVNENAALDIESIDDSNASNAMIILFSKKPGVTFREFKDRVENDWVPNLQKVCGPLFPLTYVRRYISQKESDDPDKIASLPSVLIGRAEDIVFDCLVEATFEDNLHMMQWFNLLNEDEPARIMMESESKFSDINKLRVILMENRVTVNKTRKAKTWE
ncbi:hypothetical protein P280DRAFT_466751 [Massarina eburnea CBS 473.64]|uniref:EthD domain-containing protein n=1 Tax=Massarina eburnea CBS 473.64 TaxID=1395130 RepID=A0A6A6SBC7_9PLEO|nr:hypothetical protein P280DRAFT_466751 [Massarina eburnea CBS 473.64]